MPSCLRSSGHMPRPWRIACAGRVESHRLAVDAQLAAVAAVQAEQQARQLGAPRAEQAADADDLAAAQRSRSTGFSWPRRPKPRASSTRCAGRRRGRVSSRPAAALSSRPTIAVISAAGGSSAARYSPTRSPLRSTVMRSEIAYIWSRKWVTNRIAMPSPRSWRSTREQALDLLLVQAGGRLVEDQHLGLDARARGRSPPSAARPPGSSTSSRVTSMSRLSRASKRARSRAPCASSRCATARPRPCADSGRRRCSPPPRGSGRG